MRLIDADELLEKMSDRYDEKKPIVADSLAEGFMQMEKLIKEQTTAYDIDKVVEELREWSVNVTILELHNNELGEYEEECKRDVICTLNAIEIVKQGLKEQNNG